MERERFIQKLERIPVPVLPTLVGAVTLSNVYAGMGFTWLRHIAMFVATFTLICYLIKIAIHPRTFLKEYGTTVPASLYPALTMLLMILGSYYFEFSAGIGKAVWFVGVILHALHILIFTIRYVILSRDKDTFVPSWFVTYDGILVSCVVGGVMNEPRLLAALTWFGIVVYIILLVLMIWRLVTHEIKDAVYHTQGILMAPCSLCVVSYLNVTESPSPAIVGILYACVIGFMLFFLFKLPRFLSFTFHPGFAGMTFPMAIGIVASTKVADYLEAAGNELFSMIVKQLSGIQIYLATAIISFVLYHFVTMFFRSMKG